MNLIDHTYFVDLLWLGDLNTATPQGEARKSKLTAAITRHQPVFLAEVFGKELRDAFLAGIDETTPEARWTALRNELVDSINKLSPLANYVWFKLWQESQVLATQSGDKAVSDGVLTPSPNTAKAFSTWNAMCATLDGFNDWLEYHVADYPEWDGSGRYWYYHRMNEAGI